MYEQSEYWRGVNNAKARASWATYLASYSWDAFFTSTSSNKSVRRHALSCCEHARDAILAVTGISRLFIASEEFRLGDWHCHGLVKWHDSLKDSLISSKSLEIGGRLSKIGYCNIEPANSVVAVADYVSKYVVKDTPWEYIIGGRGWTVPFKDGA